MWERDGPAAAPRACGRPAARLGGRCPHSLLARRGRTRPRSGSRLATTSVPKCLGELRVFGEGRAQPLEVTQPQGDGPAPNGPARRVSEAHVLLALLRLEQLDERGEPLLARTLWKGQLLDGVGMPPWRGGRLLGFRCSCRHDRQRSRKLVACVSRECAEDVSEVSGTNPEDM